MAFIEYVEMYASSTFMCNLFIIIIYFTHLLSVCKERSQKNNI